jgi:penicillin-binding protein 1A
MLKANNVYNPRKNPERSLERRNVVIDQMLKYGYLSEAEAKKYKSEPLGVVYNLITYNEGPAPYLMENDSVQHIRCDFTASGRKCYGSNSRKWPLLYDASEL